MNPSPRRRPPRARCPPKRHVRPGYDAAVPRQLALLAAATPDGKKQYVYCLDADTGRVLHQKLLFENEKPEPLGNAVHAALVEDITGQSVLITGCGPTGLFATAVARTAGAGLLIASDLSDYRLALAKQLGADHVVKAGSGDGDVIERLTDGQGVDVALEMSGNPTAIHTAFRFVKNGGRVTLFGIPEAPVSFDMTNEIIFKGIRVFGITGRKLFQTWYRLTGLFKAGLNITPVVTHTLPMERFAEGFDLIAKGQCGKIVLLP